MTPVQEPSIEQMNKVIAEFTGITNVNDVDYNFALYEFDNGRMCYLSQMQYHSSWDWLMPIYAKVDKHFYGCYIGDLPQKNMKSEFVSIQTAILGYDIKEAHLSIYEYITQFVKP